MRVRVTDDLLVPLDCGFHPLGMRIPALRRALDVRKENVTSPLGKAAREKALECAPPPGTFAVRFG